MAKAPHEWVAEQLFRGPQVMPNAHLAPDVRGGQAFGRKAVESMLVQMIEGLRIDRAGDHQRLRPAIESRGLQPRQEAPRVVEVPVGQQHGSDAAAAEPRRTSFGFQVTTCDGEPVLEAFPRVNDDQAFRARQHRSADRTLGRRTR